jgi:hypothetical protein
LLQPFRKVAGVGEREMSVRVLWVQVDRPQRRVHGFLSIRAEIIGPSIRNQPNVDPGAPDVRFGKARIDPARLPEQFPRLDVHRPSDLVETPSSLSDQIPRRHVARMRR